MMNKTVFGYWFRSLVLCGMMWGLFSLMDMALWLRIPLVALLAISCLQQELADMKERRK